MAHTLNVHPAWLNTFKTLVETGHFTKTAEQLYMTQPGVSQHIQKLEAACSEQLITREKKQFHLTEQGRIVYEYALEQEERVKQLTQALSFDRIEEGRCLIGCSGAFSLGLYPELMRYQVQHPKLHIELEVTSNNHILTLILEDAMDMGIVTQVPDKSLFESVHIGVETLCLALPSESGIDARLDKQTLFDLGLVKHPDAEHYLNLYLENCGDESLQQLRAIDLPVRTYINQLQQILLPITHGIGFTVLPLSAVKHFQESSAQQAKTITLYQSKNKVTEPLYLVSKRQRKLPKRFEPIIERIKDQAS